MRLELSFILSVGIWTCGVRCQNCQEMFAILDDHNEGIPKKISSAAKLMGPDCLDFIMDGRLEGEESVRDLKGTVIHVLQKLVSVPHSSGLSGDLQRSYRKLLQTGAAFLRANNKNQIQAIIKSNKAISTVLETVIEAAKEPMDPVKDIAAAITPEILERTLRVLHADLQTRFGIAGPRIAVAGLNPHAGESGHMGREEIEVIIPVLERLRRDGMALSGPLPADTLFTQERLAGCDCVLAMYHDQGLPVLKYASFGHAVNVTLGLPIIRTSVDHGTALDIAGTGTADRKSTRLNSSH